MKKDFGVTLLQSIKEAKIFLMWHCYMMIAYYFVPDLFTPFVWWLLFTAYAMIILVVGVQEVSNKSHESLEKTYKRLLVVYEEILLENEEYVSTAYKLAKAGANESALAVLDKLLEKSRTTNNQIKINNNTRGSTNVH